ncbi:spore protease YyaC [Virgibacillus indicus]|uniref:Spore protease YyaC n=1 Tax=Virgibacillus indicus TaxID=2024554 RepID=A0A265NBQ6_9BACI|nr:spore protease YyaC [Virgibacillus indicus]OZU89458.1 spore protease YyaC [Virgibacillus indicus]
MNLKKRFSQANEKLRMPHTDPELFQSMSEKITSWLPEFPHEYVVVCIGTDRSTGDALGPLTGTLLSEMKPRHMTVYGTLHEPVHATNLVEYTNFIKEKHRNPYIIAVDACLGQTTSVGHLITGKGPLKPGAALNKPLPSVGNIHITGVVNISGFMEYSVLQNTRLSIVMDMSEKIAGLLNIIDQRLKYHFSAPAIVIQQEKQQSM